MKKGYFSVLAFVLLLCSIAAKAQGGTWTWMNGPNFANGGQVLGTQGIPDPANHPRPLYESGEWIDHQGNFWLFGGVGTTGLYGDLWKYDPTINQWAYMKGFAGVADQDGVYGVQGTPSPANKPGCRGFGFLTWVDQAGDLWLFGGSGHGASNSFGPLSDLWRYNIATNEWTWMKGLSAAYGTSIYGTQGVPGPANFPSAREETTCAWVGQSNQLWMFGGDAGGGTAFLDDMWMYDVATNNWTWMSGSNTSAGFPVYGTKGVPSPTNTPGGRSTYARWTDGAGNLWLFGGKIKTLQTSYYYNDIWKYDPISREWTWMSGQNVPDQPTVVGQSCLPCPDNIPSGRFENKACYTDSSGKFYVLGGLAGPGNSTYLNDFWVYDPNTDMWARISGNSINGAQPVYGTMGVPAPSNFPGTRAGSPGWHQANGDFWVFGGVADLGGMKRCDMWRFQPDSNCIAISSTGQVSPTASPAAGCLPLNVNFSNLSASYNSFLWNFGDGNTSTQANPGHTYPNAGTYQAALIASGSDCNGPTIDTFYITINVDSSPQISAGADTILCGGQNLSLVATATNYTALLWSTGSTTATTTVISSGNYWVQASNGSCAVSDTVQATFIPLPIVNFPMADTLCPGQMLTLNIGQPYPANYLWQDGSTDSIFTITTAGNYWAMASNSCGTSVDSIQIADPVSPWVDLGPDTILCVGDAYMLDAGHAGANYMWSSGATGQTIVVSNPGIYAVTVTDADCRDSAHVAIGQLALPSVNVGADTTICDVDSVMLLASVNGATSISWNTGDTLPEILASVAGWYVLSAENRCGSVADSMLLSTVGDPFASLGDDRLLCGRETIILSAAVQAAQFRWNTGETTQSIVVNDPGLYWLEITNACGSASDSLQITIETDSTLFVPNVITPNDDAINECFKIEVRSSDEYELRIFDRWGQQIFASTNPQNLWCGELNGEPMPEGVYFYTLRTTDCHRALMSRVGTVVLLR